MKYLGIDYGKRKIGFAISEGELASPFKTIEVRSLNDALTQAAQIINSEAIDKVVVGMPESGQARKITKKFIQFLKKKVDVEETGEVLTSRNAQRIMLYQNIPRKKRMTEDAYAASLILQDYLDKK